MSAAQLSVAFFLQVFVILAVCRLVGRLARRAGQPQVVGEMVAGVLLGPSLFGLLFPDLQLHVFPGDSLKVLYVGAQFGVGLYMFLVGVEFNVDLFRTYARRAVSVSVAGMLTPFALGAALALWFVTMPGLFAAKATTWEAVLFLGAAMSITAFPMLARIIHERGLTGTALGTLALAAGCIDDAAAWCALALVLASFSGSGLVAVTAIAGGALYAVGVLTIGRRLLVRMGQAVERTGELTPTALAAVLALFALAGWITDAIGIHTVFGGFLLGVAMPRGLLTREITRQLEPFTVVFLLPLFFTFSGLNTRLDMIASPSLILVALSVLLAACFGKGVACWAAARWSGADQRTALALGTLMNARGLMELILINIGLQHGIIGPALFSVLVLMALVTTLMASPVFNWVYGRYARTSGTLAATPSEA